MLEEKRYEEIHGYIENLKYELGGEEKTVKKLTTLQKYLKDGLPRYQELTEEILEPPDRSRISWYGNNGKLNIYSIKSRTM